jgi:DNA replicative helicase MCM subunit Mcm2 (Cdc46/Mcm family)
MVIQASFLCATCGEKHSVTFGEDEDMPEECTKSKSSETEPLPQTQPDIWDLTVWRSEKNSRYAN